MTGGVREGTCRIGPEAGQDGRASGEEKTRTSKRAESQIHVYASATARFGPPSYRSVGIDSN